MGVGRQVGRVRYGRRFPASISDGLIELWAWRNYGRIKSPELERWEHLRNAALSFVPNLQKTINPWFERCVRAYAEHSYIAALGCSNSAKTYSFHTLAFLDFMSDPLNTQVICTTTSVQGLKTRMWPILSNLFRAVKPADWVMKTMPQMIIQSRRDDPKHSIRGAYSG